MGKVREKIEIHGTGVKVDIKRLGLVKQDAQNQDKCRQWRIYIEAKKAVFGGPRAQAAPKIYIKKMSAE